MKEKTQKRCMQGGYYFFAYRPTAQQWAVLKKAAAVGIAFGTIIDDLILEHPETIEMLILQYIGQPRSSRQGTGSQMTYNVSGTIREVFTYIISNGISASQVINDLFDLYMLDILQHVEKRAQQFERVKKIMTSLGD